MEPVNEARLSWKEGIKHMQSPGSGGAHAINIALHSDADNFKQSIEGSHVQRLFNAASSGVSYMCCAVEDVEEGQA